LYGAARAAEAAGDAAVARDYSQKLTEVAFGDDAPN